MMTIKINRAPVMALWAAVVAERLGYDADAAHTLGKVVAGLNAQAKGRTLGIYEPAVGPDGGPAPRSGLGEELWVPLLGRSVPARRTAEGLRAVVKDKPVEPESVRAYFASKFGEHLEAARAAMEKLADAVPREELGERAYGLYERFRPQIPRGRAGWGAAGELDLELIESLARQ